MKSECKLYLLSATDLVNVSTVQESGMNQANTKVSASKISSTSTKPAENGTKSRASVASSRIRAHAGLKLNLNLKKLAPNVKVNLSESENSKDLVNVSTVQESGMNQANTKVSASKISSTSTKPAENGTKSRASVASSSTRAHAGLKLNLNLKAPNVKVNFSESESSKETASYLRDKSCERHSRKGKDDIGECIKVISETFKIVDNSERKRSPSREKAPKVPMNGIYVEEKSYARCTRSRAQKILHPSKDTNSTLKPEMKRRSPSREKSQKYAVKTTTSPPQPAGKFSPTKMQRLSERLTAHTESSKRKLRNPNVQEIFSNVSDLQDAEKTAVKRNAEESQHYGIVFENAGATHSAREKREGNVRNTKESQSSVAKKVVEGATHSAREKREGNVRNTKESQSSVAKKVVEGATHSAREKREGNVRNTKESQCSVAKKVVEGATHSAREKREGNVRNTKESQSSVAKREVVEVTFSKAEVSESFTSSSSTIKTHVPGAEISHLLNGAKMGLELLDAESMPVIMNGTNIDIDNLEETDVDFDPDNKGKNESGMNSSSKIPRKAQVIQSGMKGNASMKKETTVSFDSGCEDIQL